MSRPISTSSKHRRSYVVVCYDPHSCSFSYFQRIGYKHLLLREFSNKFPHCDISIFVFSSKIFAPII